MGGVRGAAAAASGGGGCGGGMMEAVVRRGGAGEEGGDIADGGGGGQQGTPVRLGVAGFEALLASRRENGEERENDRFGSAAW